MGKNGAPIDRTFMTYENMVERAKKAGIEWRDGYPGYYLPGFYRDGKRVHFTSAFCAARKVAFLLGVCTALDSMQERIDYGGRPFPRE